MFVRTELWSGCGLLVLVAAVSLSTGCKKAEGPRAPESMQAGDELDELAELAALEQQMRAYGLAPSTRKAGASKGNREDAGRDDEIETGASDADRPDEVEEEAPTDASAPVAPEEAAMEAMEPEPSSVQSMSPTVFDGTEPSAEERCSNLCSLNDAICELEIRICELSESHSGEFEYADACERAIDDCSVSGDACAICAE